MSLFTKLLPVKKKKATLETIHTELVRQRENCLTTLQCQGATHVQLLEQIATTLQGMRKDMADRAEAAKK